MLLPNTRHLIPAAKAHLGNAEWQGVVNVAWRSGWIAAAVTFMSMAAPAQEALRSSLAGEAAAEAGRLHPDSMPYNFKSGDFRLMATPSLALDWNDNVNLRKDNAEDDFILRPTLSLNASYPLTQRNLLSVNISLGYQKYFNNDELSDFYLGAGSGLSFDIYVKDWLINLHDRFSYTLNGAQRGEVSGTGNYGQFQNSAGLSGTWDLQDITVTLGYDHVNSVSLSDQFQQQDRASESFLARTGLKLNPRLTAGVEGTVSLTSYEKKLLNDNTAYSGGVFANWRPGNYFSVSPRVGYAYYAFQQTSPFTPAQDQDSWYADVSVTHQPTDYVSYTLSAGHELRLGLQSDATETWYFRPSASWSVIKNVTLTTSLFYERGKLGGGRLGGPLGGNTEENYDWYGGGLSLAYSPMRRLSMGINYRFNLRASDVASREYAQNVVGIQVTYHP